MQIYVSRNGQPIGPFTHEQVAEKIRSGDCMPTDLCWHAGLINWTPISTVLGLPAAPETMPAGMPPIAHIPPQPTRPFAQASEISAAIAIPAPRSEALGIVMVLIPALSAIMALFYVDSMSLLAGVSAATVLLTAILVAIEASQLGFGQDKSQSGIKHASPLAWFFGVIFFWIIAFPRYLYVRRRDGEIYTRGLLTVMFFVLSVIMVSRGASGRALFSLAGPPPSDIEKAINWRFNQEHSYDGTLKLHETYEITNRYSRKINGEKWYIYAFETVALTRTVRGEVGLIKRGSKWHFSNMRSLAKLTESEE
ncbi:MAG: DUF4339 domain-containing protein [Verrucomicrobia bacterium]|nr:DUF4339 domain-containing protein [Verrucomicrobiota bacterium]